MEGGGWDGRTAGRHRPALNFSAQVLIFSTAAIPVPRTVGADPQFANPTDYTFLALVPLPAKRSSPAVGGERAGLHGSGRAGMGRDGIEMPRISG